MGKRQKIEQRRLLPELSIEQLENEAVEFLYDQCKASSNIGLGFSGGKDSTVIIELMKRTGLEFTAFYHATQIDPPEVVRFIRKRHPEVKFFYPKRKFYQAIQTSAPPLPGARWCCGVLKHNDKQSKQFNPVILGIRKEESFRRNGYDRVFSKPKQTFFYPILEWNEADVWEYIEHRNLSYCSLYDEGFDRLGCVPCPYKSPKMHEISRRRWPGIYHAFENSVRKWFEKRKAEGRDMAYDTAEGFLEDWYQHKAVWYSKRRTSR